MRGNHFPFLKYFLFTIFALFADNFDFLFTYEALKLKPAPFIRKKSEVLKIAPEHLRSFEIQKDTE
jgi:hypothetical protein